MTGKRVLQNSLKPRTNWLKQFMPLKNVQLSKKSARLVTKRLYLEMKEQFRKC
jgi:hypothetical protein